MTALLFWSGIILLGISFWWNQYQNPLHATGVLLIIVSLINGTAVVLKERRKK